MSVMDVGAPQPPILPENQRLTRNPMLPQHPLGAYSDAQYEAAIAQLRADIARQYNDVLQQLGYVNEQGQFIPGTVEIGAQRQRDEFQRGSRLAEEEVTKQAQREGTLFSGIRGTKTARAQHPFVSALADLDVDVPRQLSQLYGQATGLVDDYTRGQNMLLADAATRRAAGIITSPGDVAPPPTEPISTGPPGGVGPDVVIPETAVTGAEVPIAGTGSMGRHRAGRTLSDPAAKALAIRSQALNRLYGL